MYVIRVYDPRGTFVDTTGRVFLTKAGARRDARRYASHKFLVPYQGDMVPLCNYVVEKR